MAVEKISVSFEPELGAAIRAAAASAGQSVSAWLAAAAQDRLRRGALAAAVAGWEHKFGALTEGEVAAAERILDPPAAAARRPGAA